MAICSRSGHGDPSLNGTRRTEMHSLQLFWKLVLGEHLVAAQRVLLTRGESSRRPYQGVIERLVAVGVLVSEGAFN